MRKKKRSPFSSTARAAWAISLVLGLAAACSAGSAGIQGLSCSTDGDCQSGLRCLSSRVRPDAGGDAGCASVDRACLKPCQADADCTAQGPGLVCLASCDGTAACLPR